MYGGTAVPQGTEARTPKARAAVRLRSPQLLCPERSVNGRDRVSELDIVENALIQLHLLEATH